MDERRDLPHATERRTLTNRGKMARSGGCGGGGCSALRAHNDFEGTYSEEDVEALMAIDAYKVNNRRPHPHLTELLDVLRGLGWGKCK